jgi:esterase/lipase superfamily enzyme
VPSVLDPVVLAIQFVSIAARRKPQGANLEQKLLLRAKAARTLNSLRLEPELRTQIRATERGKAENKLRIELRKRVDDTPELLRLVAWAIKSLQLLMPLLTRQEQAQVKELLSDLEETSETLKHIHDREKREQKSAPAPKPKAPPQKTAATSPGKYKIIVPPIIKIKPTAALQKSSKRFSDEDIRKAIKNATYFNRKSDYPLEIIDSSGLPGKPSVADVRSAPPTTPEEAVRKSVCPVWFATNRIQLTGKKKWFGTEADPDGTVHYGKCEVTIPETHKFGSVGTPLFQRVLNFRWKDDHLKLRSVETITDADSFYKKLHDELSSLLKDKRQLFIYLHGFNNTFEEAAIRSAQMAVDLKIKGAVGFFSWPSVGKTGLLAYTKDGSHVVNSEEEITTFLLRMASDTAADSVILFAHSMGSRALTRSLKSIAEKVAAGTAVKFAQIIFAAPDIEAKRFSEIATAFNSVANNTTMYVSSKDRALKASSIVNDTDRAGFTPPVTIVPPMHTIECTDVDLTLLGHSYYADAVDVLHDMFDLINFQAPPKGRARVHSETFKGVEYWKIGA